MLPPGAMIAGYRVERVLGQGGMGVVYLVANPELPRRDALKLLSPDLSGDAAFRARFTREADVASMLDHPNITAIYRRGTTEAGQLWIAMQFVDGTDADKALRAGTMTPRRALHIITEVGKALDYAHRQQVVHRDIKPGNFLLSGPVGPDERVLLADFGIARALDDVALTVTGSVTATVAYAAPELLTGGRGDGRSDIYSLGCTFFRLLTGKTPYHGERTPAAVMTAHIQKPPPRVSTEVPGLPAGLDAVIAKAMAKNPDHRYRSAAEFTAAAAAAFEEQATVPVRRPVLPAYRQPVSEPVVAQRRGLKRPAVLAAVGAVVLLVAASVIGVSVSGKDSEPPPAVPAGPPVAETALPGLLSDVTDLADTVGSTRMTVTGTDTAFADGGDAASCSGARLPAQASSYAESGSTAVLSESARSTNAGPPTHEAVQAVILFPDAAAAQRSVSEQADRWQQCAASSIAVTADGASQATSYRFGSPSTADGVVSLRATREGGSGWACERGLTSASNVVVDVMVCRYDPAGQAAALATAIRDRVD